MLFVSLALVAVGIGLGFVMYGKAGQLASGRVRPTGGQDRHRTAETDPLERAKPALFHFLENKMWLDEIYDRTVVAWSGLAARVYERMRRNFCVGVVWGIVEGEVGLTD